MGALVKIHTQFWLIFFLITIGVVGFVFMVPFYFPIMALGRIFPALKGIPDFIMCVGIRVLMSIQPWFSGEVDLRLPPRGAQGVLLVSNHRSHLDVFILLSRIAGIRILAKDTLFRIPVLSLMMRVSRQISVPRGRLDSWLAAMNTVRERLIMGERVHVFPEMTRCVRGFLGTQPFTAGPFLAAVQGDALVVPIVFRGTDEVWPRGEVGLNFRRPVAVRALPPLRARDFATAEELRGEVQRQIEAELV